jgi:UDP-N-acetylglucosamine--N-acetylmuramyl-(pentapeptide) pyrophosphoryl-undecaprenol N-acetylglucosamine transferase
MPMAEQPSERCIDVEKIRVIFAGGGTGGHLFPAIALADELRKIMPGAGIMFIGTRNKIEARVVPAAGFLFLSIWISGFHRSLRIGNLLFPVKVMVSMLQSRSILRSFKPDVVVGTGGYVSGPVLRMATLLGIPTLIQEQNSYPGVTTRVLAAKVNEVHLTFENSKKYFQRTDNLFLSGNPTRGTLDNVNRADALRNFGFEPQSDEKTILVVGGSLGARTINRAIEKMLPHLLQNNYRLIWQTGNEGYASAAGAAGQFPSGRVWVGQFIDRMDCAYAASDLVVCRAGATTIAELTRLGKPSVLIPYPFAAADHQVENARALAGNGAAEIVLDTEVEIKLEQTMMMLLESDRLQSMGRLSRELGKPGAARVIAERIVGLSRTHHYRAEA